MNLSIRYAQEKDVLALSKLVKELTAQEISEEGIQNRLQFIADSPFDSLYVCEENDEILGAFGFRIRENIEEVSRFGEISVIVVSQNARLRGIGKYMMNYAEQLAKEQECVGTWLVSGFGREEDAHKFYKQLGYEVTGYRFVKKINP